VPSADIFDEDLVLIRTMPPWGYVFRLYDIATNEASSSLPVISATVPPTLPGAGASVTLNPNHVLDTLLNATSGAFVSGTATSTESFYVITSRYWRALCLLVFIIYIIKRIIGVANHGHAVHATLKSPH